jgi:SAM-dependent methyltransferase
MEKSRRAVHGRICEVDSLDGDPYEQGRDVPALADCYFYHTMDVPDYGLMTGEWDLRESVDEYLGHEPVRGMRVLEVGTASGFLCFEMERRGAEVIAYDLSKTTPWDVVPFNSVDVTAFAALRADHIAKMNNSWWLSRHAFGSDARMVYGTVYDIPAAIGQVDLCTFGAVLLHVRDPLLALQNAAKLNPRTIVVTELARRRGLGLLPERPSQLRSPLFLPDASKSEPLEAWWSFSPESISNLLSMVGYRTKSVVRHDQRFRGRSMPMFTVVASR